MDCNYVANLRKMMLYNANGDLVNDNVYTKVLLNLTIHTSRHKAKTKILKSIKCFTLLQICEKMTLCNPNVDLVNANVYKKVDYTFRFILKICSKKHILTPVTVKGGNSV